MIAWVALNLYNLFVLAVFVGPLGYWLYRCDQSERAGRESMRFASQVAIGVGIFVVSGAIGSALYRAAPALEQALKMVGPF